MADKYMNYFVNYTWAEVRVHQGFFPLFFFFIHSLRFIQRRLSCILFFFSLFLSICTPDFFFFRLYSIRYTLCCKQDGCR